MPLKRVNDIKVLFSAVLFVTLLAAGVPPAFAQSSNSWWGSARWFDWSDYRARAYGRVFLATMESGSFSSEGNEYDLTTDLGISRDPEPFRVFCAEMYIDRVGVRYYPEEEEHNFWGLIERKLSEIEIPSGFVGFDVELVRLSSFRFGANMDFGLNKVTVRDRNENHTANSGDEYIYLESDRPSTIGAHLTAIPLRIREVPFIFEARAAFPLPFYRTPNQARLTEWEVSAGFRPAIWEQSAFGHTTFSVSAQGGYKRVILDVFFEERDAELHAVWGGPFMQIGIHF